VRAGDFGDNVRNIGTINVFFSCDDEAANERAIGKLEEPSFTQPWFGTVAVKGWAIDAKNAAVHHRAATVAIGALLALWIAVRRRRRLAALPPVLRAAPRVRSPIAAIYDDIARALARSGMPRDAAATPRELAQRLVERGDGAARDVGELTELYYAAEWGHVRDPTAEQRATSLGHAIRATLDAARRASR